MKNKEDSFEWAKEFDEKFPYDTLVSAHQDWTYNAIKSFISSTIQKAVEASYNKGKEDGMTEEAIGCHKHCEQAVEAALRSRDKEIVREIEAVQEYYDESNDTAWNALERLKDRLSSQKEI